MRKVLEETDEARWSDAHQRQLWPEIWLVQAIVPAMVQKGWGRVVGVTSATVKQPMPQHGLSTVYRAGVTGLLKHLANEVADHGVTVHGVPGLDQQRRAACFVRHRKRIQTIPVTRRGRPEELAAAVAFLASNLAGFITGTSLSADGGMVGSLY